MGITSTEKTPTQSKKFIAYMTASFLTKGLLFFMVNKGEGSEVIIAAIAGMVFLDTGYIIGVCALDALVHYVTALALKGEKVLDAIKPEVKQEN